MDRMVRSNSADVDREDPVRDGAWRLAARRRHDPDAGGELATDVVFAIADAAGVDPTELRSPTLYDAVDVAAIEDPFFRTDSSGASTGTVTGSVAFRYADYRVTIDSDGWIAVDEPTRTDPR